MLLVGFNLLLLLETENPLVLPTSASFRTRFNDNNDNNANKKVGQCHETVIRSFSSSSGSFTSATPDGNRMNAANGVLDEAALNSPQVVAPVRTFTKVRLTLKNHELISGLRVL